MLLAKMVKTAGMAAYTAIKESSVYDFTTFFVCSIALALHHLQQMVFSLNGVP